MTDSDMSAAKRLANIHGFNQDGELTWDIREALTASYERGRREGLGEALEMCKDENGDLDFVKWQIEKRMDELRSRLQPQQDEKKE